MDEVSMSGNARKRMPVARADRQFKCQELDRDAGFKGVGGGFKGVEGRFRGARRTQRI